MKKSVGNNIAKGNQMIGNPSLKTKQEVSHHHDGPKDMEMSKGESENKKMKANNNQATILL